MCTFFHHYQQLAARLLSSFPQSHIHRPPLSPSAAIENNWIKASFLWLLFALTPHCSRAIERGVARGSKKRCTTVLWCVERAWPGVHVVWWEGQKKSSAWNPQKWETLALASLSRSEEERKKTKPDLMDLAAAFSRRKGGGSDGNLRLIILRGLFSPFILSDTLSAA